MSSTKYRDRKYTGPDYDRYMNAISLPVQAWIKASVPSSNAKGYPMCKWVKSDRQIVFEDERDEPMTPADKETDQGTPGTEPPETEIKRTPASMVVDDEESTHTPKLSDISDADRSTRDDEDNDDESNADDLNDPSRHPAYAPHAAAQMSDDEVMTDSTGPTPQTSAVEPTKPEEDAITDQNTVDSKSASPEQAQ